MHHPTKIEIRQARLSARLTQKAAAELLGVSERGFQKWEYGEARMRPIYWNRLLEATVKGRSPTSQPEAA